MYVTTKCHGRLIGRTFCLFGEAYRRLKVQLYPHCQYNIVNKMQFAFDFRAALFGRFRSWLGEVLGVELEPTVDISCARYEYTGENSLYFLGSFGQILHTCLPYVFPFLNT